MPRYLGHLFLAVTTVSAAAEASGVTYYKDVLPVIQKNCQGAIAPAKPLPWPS
jgi:hypothetical protein